MPLSLNDATRTIARLSLEGLIYLAAKEGQAIKAEPGVYIEYQGIRWARRVVPAPTSLHAKSTAFETEQEVPGPLQPAAALFLSEIPLAVLPHSCHESDTFSSHKDSAVRFERRHGKIWAIVVYTDRQDAEELLAKVAAGNMPIDKEKDDAYQLTYG